jgi:hypothetical protein
MDQIKYILVVPDGVGIRNFFCTRVIDRLLETGQVLVWHALPEESIAPFQERWGERVRWVKLPPIVDGLVERLFRQAKIFAQLYWQQKESPDVQLRRRRPPGRLKARLLYLAAHLLGRACSFPRGIQWLDRMHQRSAYRAPHTKEFLSFLSVERPSMMFCTHQRALEAVPAMLAARRLGIHSAVFIYSWDNLPRGRMPVYADTYVVWSDHMKRELLGYYPDVIPGRVDIVGTPQFENYFNSSLIVPKERFFGEHGLDIHRPVICFSGSDITSPFDPVYLEDLADALLRVPAGERPQILFRRSPVDTSDRFDGVLRRHPEIAVSNPRWQRVKNGDWSQLVPTQEDGTLLVNVVYHSDVVVNVGSTMGMDFAIFDKPGIFVAYNPEGHVEKWDIDDYYRLPHFVSVHELQPVYWARSPQELGELVLHALKNRFEKREARKAWLELIVRQPLDSASERFADEMRKLALNGNSVTAHAG